MVGGSDTRCYLIANGAANSPEIEARNVDDQSFSPVVPV